MPTPTLLADLALRLASSPEDVATEALTLVLGRSRVAAEAMNALISRWTGDPDTVVARWKSQVAAADDARTDMEGEDFKGVLSVILENKFDASLTPNQPATYLRRLPSEKGLLAFIVPTRRLNALQLEVTERAALAGFGSLDFHVSSAGRVAKIGPMHTMVVTSWEVVLGVIATASAHHGESASRYWRPPRLGQRPDALA